MKSLYMKLCIRVDGFCHYATHNTHVKKCPVCNRKLTVIKKRVVFDNAKV